MIPDDKDLYIQRYYFLGGPIEIGNWSNQDGKMKIMNKVFRKYGGEWRQAKQGQLADLLVRIVYLKSSDTLESAWQIVSTFLQDEKQQSGIA